MPSRYMRRGKPTRRSFLKTGSAGVAALALAGCSSQNPSGDGNGGDGTTKTKAPENIPEGGTFTLGTPSPPKGLNFLATSSAYSYVILDQLLAAGTALDPFTFEIKPYVYTDWTVKNAESDNAKPDVYFNVRKNLKFNNNEPLKLEDVLFTYHYMMEQKPGRFVSTMEPIESVEKASGNKWDVHMKLNKPVGTYEISQLSIPILKKSVWKDVKKFRTYNPPKNGGPIGLGAGKLTKYQPDTSAEVTYTDDFALGKLDWIKNHPKLKSGYPFLDKFRIKVYGSATALQQAFLQGEVDSVYGSIDANKVEKVKNNKGQTIVPGKDSGYSYYGFNLRRTPLDDASLRQALSMLYDDYYWINRLALGYAIEGDFVMPPGFEPVRPESASKKAKMLKDPATQAFTFRSKPDKPSVPDIKTIRNFLTQGKIINGDPGTFAGKKYPGSITGIKASQTKAKHDYSFGPVVSNSLKKAGADKEIRVNGKTVPEIHGGPLQQYVYPAKETPEIAKMTRKWTQNIQKLGIPIENKVLTFNSTLGKVYSQEDFDMYTMGWSDLSPFAVGSLYSLFHSDNADNHSKKEGYNKNNTTTQLNNSMGYTGADELITNARTEMDTKKRNELARKAVERIYLDFPVMVYQFDEITWPINSAKFGGWLEGIPDPGAAYLENSVHQIYKKQ